mmetsp:Transcript_17790/g.44507  ORF Transcript_17790/g.44507 Transcript_17790/m.44507 type:complete len:154 (-) Transcript_17790:551-1012(-)|eukprot:CAMPEP_0179004880 /NCGR_PEP_ID=MMETSP0795-20121207/13573_1 /TAXON_ID=88552 /ORGANISM="Amoebophrya sp., Strain Ameob2" /LENGTH=153 /DNA_ID=CAMNT_0020699237 /DNA_START=167 /DNA_END=628 /DNA_ORIENTATION=-
MPQASGASSGAHLTNGPSSAESSARSFQIIGGFPSIRKGFEQRGWVADDESEAGWDLKYTIRKKDISFNELRESQVVNYFPTNHEFTTKISLTTNLANLCWMNDVEDAAGHAPKTAGGEKHRWVADDSAVEMKAENADSGEVEELTSREPDRW